MKRSKRRPEAGGDSEPSASEARLAAMNLLARREHSTRELQHKLSDRGFPAELIDAALTALQQEGLQSDARFAESFVRNRTDRGYGPVRIRAELRERDVDDDVIDAELDERCPDWFARARAARAKRFGSDSPADWNERARQMRFLQYRGFTAEQVRRALDGEID